MELTSVYCWIFFRHHWWTNYSWKNLSSSWISLSIFCIYLSGWYFLMNLLVMNLESSGPWRKMEYIDLSFLSLQPKPGNDLPFITLSLPLFSVQKFISRDLTHMGRGQFFSCLVAAQPYVSKSCWSSFTPLIISPRTPQARPLKWSPQPPLGTTTATWRSWRPAASSCPTHRMSWHRQSLRLLSVSSSEPLVASQRT